MSGGITTTTRVISPRCYLLESNLSNCVYKIGKFLAKM